jgi:hypothetical protein
LSISTLAQPEQQDLLVIQERDQLATPVTLAIPAPRETQELAQQAQQAVKDQLDLAAEQLELLG